MSVEVMAAAWRSDVDGTVNRFVLVALADRADDEGYCWPGIANLMRKTGLSRTSVKRSIRYLEDLEVLRRAPRWTEAGDQTSNMYRIDVGRLRELRVADEPSDGESEHETHFRRSSGGGSPQARGVPCQRRVR